MEIAYFFPFLKVFNVHVYVWFSFVSLPGATLTSPRLNFATAEGGERRIIVGAMSSISVFANMHTQAMITRQCDSNFLQLHRVLTVAIMHGKVAIRQ